jgi:hypothetical protein
MKSDYLNARMDRWVEVAKDRASRAEGMRHLYHHPNTPPHEKAAAEARLKQMGEPLGDPEHYNRTQQRTRRPNPPPGSSQPPPRGSQPPPRPGGAGSGSRSQDWSRQWRQGSQPPPRTGNPPPRGPGGPGFSASDWGYSDRAHDQAFGRSRFDYKKRSYQSFSPTHTLKTGSPSRRTLAGVAVGGGLLTTAAAYRGYKKMPKVKGMNEAESKRRRSGTREVVAGSGLMTGGVVGGFGSDITSQHVKTARTWDQSLHGSPGERASAGYKEAHTAFRGSKEGLREAAAAKKLMRIHRGTVAGSAAAGLGGLAMMVHGGNRANAADRDMRNRRKREKAKR